MVAFDPRRDVAILRVPSIDRPSLPLADAAVAETGAVYGHPGGGVLQITPFRVGQKIVAVGADIYDKAHDPPRTCWCWRARWLRASPDRR